MLRKIVIIALLVTAVGAYPAYRAWASRQMDSFKTRCAAAAAQEDWESLEAIAGRWAAWDPASGDAWLYSAEAAAERREFALASERLWRVPDDDVRCVAALSHRVELLFTELNDPKGAARTCRRILRIDPRSAMAHQRLIFFLSMTVQRQEMVRQIREAIRLRREPPEAYVYLLGADWIHFSNGYATNSRWLEGAPDDELFLVARACHLAWSARYGKSATGGPLSGPALMAECRKRFPENTEVLAYYVEKAVADGDADQVADLLADLPETAWAENRFWRARGWLHAAQDEAAEAQQAYREAIKRNSYDWKSRHELAAELRRSGRPEEAAEMALKAAEGKELEIALLELPNASEASGQLLSRMRQYAKACGDTAVEGGLNYRLRLDHTLTLSGSVADRKGEEAGRG